MTFIEFARAHGLVIDHLPPEGVWRRYKTTDKPQHKNGAAVYNGDYGHVQNHGTMQETALWQADGDAKVAPIDPAVAERRRDELRRQRIAGLRRARDLWVAGRPLNRLHPYIERKGLAALGCAVLRQHDGQLLVPMWRGDALMNVQRIEPDGAKRFVYGAPAKGSYLVLDRPRAALTALVEGLATGLAVFQSVQQARDIVAFNTGNLIPVVEFLKPSGSVVMCGDDDHGTMARRGFNPGRDAARNVADLIGCGVAFPEDIEGSDFADFLKEHGEGAARRMERHLLAHARYVPTAVP